MRTVTTLEFPSPGVEWSEGGQGVETLSLPLWALLWRAGNRFHELIFKFQAVVEVFDGHAFVFAMHTIIVHFGGGAGDAVGRNANLAEEEAIGGAGFHF